MAGAGRDECRDGGDGDVRGDSLLTLLNEIAPVRPQQTVLTEGDLVVC